MIKSICLFAIGLVLLIKGANVFNLVLVSGVAVSLTLFDVSCENLLLDTGLNLSRWQGIALLCIYATFVVCQFVL